MQTRVWLAQRLSAVVLAIAVTVHLGGIIVAVQGGLSAAEIIARVGGNGVAALFYGIFVVACAVHAPIGLRTVLLEMTALKPRLADGVAGVFAVAVLVLGLRAVLGFYQLGAG
ncbi:MAG: succinate dehydrogenase [Rhodospirillales bacterium]|nr:succinate dehydrogenase [Rhodospirillales bacterium]